MVTRFSLKVKGLRQLENTNGNVIFAANHLSEIDPLLIVSALPFNSKHFPIIYVSLVSYGYKKEKWKQILYGGFFFRMIGGYPAYKGLKNYEKALSHHLKILTENRNIGIFPFGCVCNNQKKVKAKGGVAFLSEKTGRPIIPLRISGTHHFNLRNIFFGGSKIEFAFGKAIYPAKLFKNKAAIVNENRNDYEKAAKIVMNSLFRI